MNNNNSNCLNCNTALQGQFCHKCGQENTNLKITFTELVRDFFGDMFNFDSRFYRTIVPLLIKPGFLTTEYFQGKRAPYTPPLRLFLFCSFLFFLWIAVVDTGIVDYGDTPNASEQINAQLEQADNTEKLSESEFKLLAAMSAQIANIEKNPRAFVNLLVSRLPYLMFLLLPIFATIMWIHYCFSGYSYLQHLVFVLHFQSFIYLVGFLMTIANMLYSQSYGFFALLFANIYMFFALRKVFSSSITGAILKTISILNLYLVTLGAALVGFLLLNILYFE